MKVIQSIIKEVATIDNSYFRKLKHIKDCFSIDLMKAIRDYYDTYPPQTINSINDLPRLSLDQIQQMLADEKEYGINVKQFQEKVSQKQYDQDLSKIAGVSSGAKVPLFKWMFRGCSTVPVINEQFQIGMDQLNDLFREQYLSDFPIVERVMMQPHRPYYYRGESKFYGESKPTMFRGNAYSDMLMVNTLKIEEASYFLDSIPSNKKWNANARVNYVALCQHYGLDTPMIDVTSDLMTALFFACCKWMGTKWEPMKKADIERDGDAIIHIASKEIFDVEMALDCSETMIVFPIGHQPLLRCSKQNGYMGLSVHQDRIIDLYTDKHFTTYCFSRDEDFCKWVFEECEQGDLIYPEEDSPQLIQYFKNLKESKDIPLDIVEKWRWNNSSIQDDMESVRVILARAGYKVCASDRELLSNVQVEEVNRQIQNQIDNRNINPGMRPFFTTEDIIIAKDTGKFPDNYNFSTFKSQR